MDELQKLITDAVNYAIDNLEYPSNKEFLIKQHIEEHKLEVDLFEFLEPDTLKDMIYDIAFIAANSFDDKITKADAQLVLNQIDKMYEINLKELES